MNELAVQMEPRNGTALMAAPQAMPLDDVWRLAEQVAASKFFAGVNTPAQAFTLMMICQSENLHPMEAVRIYDIIEGRPAMKASVIQARFQKSGGKIKIVRADAEEARAIFSHPVHQPDPIELAYTQKDVERAGLTGRSNHKTNPQDMKWWRLMSKSIKKICPGITNGVDSAEDAYDLQYAESLPPPSVMAKLEEAQALNVAAQLAPPVEDVLVLGYTGVGFDGRPYIRVVGDAVNYVNSRLKERAVELFGPDGTASGMPTEAAFHSHAIHSALNLWPEYAPAPASRTEGLKRLALIYQERRQWVRGELLSFLDAACVRSYEAMEEAAAKWAPEAEEPAQGEPDDVFATEGGMNN